MTDCPICYEAINASTGVATLGCSHSYHLKCIATWATTKSNCPCCRTKLSETEDLSGIRQVAVPAAAAPPFVLGPGWTIFNPGDGPFDQPVQSYEERLHANAEANAMIDEAIQQIRDHWATPAPVTAREPVSVVEIEPEPTRDSVDAIAARLLGPLVAMLEPDYREPPQIERRVLAWNPEASTFVSGS
jgi:hypothetical protein